MSEKDMRPHSGQPFVGGSPAHLNPCTAICDLEAIERKGIASIPANVKYMTGSLWRTCSSCIWWCIRLRSYYIGLTLLAVLVLILGKPLDMCEVLEKCFYWNLQWMGVHCIPTSMVAGVSVRCFASLYAVLCAHCFQTIIKIPFSLLMYQAEWHPRWQTADAMILTINNIV